MKLTRGKILVGLTVLALLVVPELALTQGPGGQGRVLNMRLRTVYATITAALADPNLMAGDRLLIAGLIDESANMGISFTGAPNITIVSESRPGFRATITTGGNCLASGAVVDLSGRTGSVTWIGGTILVPDGCIAFLSNAGPGTALTIQGVTIQGDAGSFMTGIGGIRTNNEPGGPFRFISNRITGELDVGIVLDGDGVNNINATIRSNVITVTGDAGGNAACVGILLTRTRSATTIAVERNRVDGGGPTLSCTGAGGAGGIGIFVGRDDVTVQRNTIQNFNSGTNASGVRIDGTSNVVVKSNVIRNNNNGVVVDPVTCSGPPFPLINNNNITGSTTLALSFGSCSYDLDATNNFWGASTGPQDADGDAFCGSPSPPTAANCNTDAGAGGAIDSAAKGMGTADCCGGSAVTCNGSGFVKTCPFKLFAIFGIGA